MAEDKDEDAENLEVAQRWCESNGPHWEVIELAGSGGTAATFSVKSPDTEYALKIFSKKYSQGRLGKESLLRLAPQLKLGDHDCINIVKFYKGGRFEDRLFLLMSRAPGQELEKRLNDIPRNKIRGILDQIAKACIYLRSKNLCHRDIKSANIFISDDFEVATLLDLSVIRDIDDPVGIGTDHGGQLPVVATSRYSPPEYLFRLIPAGLDLWHALDIYQLGGLLHDLIMKKPMFQDDYQLSKENRYRFAWIVATKSPLIDDSDVDSDMLLLAKRALDKDWQRRSALRLEDFLDDAETRKSFGLEALGIATPRLAKSRPTNATNLHKKITDTAKTLETELKSRLRKNGVTATHEIKNCTNDNKKTIEFGWTSAEADFSNVKLVIYIDVDELLDGIAYNVSLELSAMLENTERKATLSLPAAPESDDIANILAGSVFSAMAVLASELMTAHPTVTEK